MSEGTLGERRGALDLSELNESVGELEDTDMHYTPPHRFHYGEPNPWQPTDVPVNQRDEPVYSRDNPIPR